MILEELANMMGMDNITYCSDYHTCSRMNTCRRPIPQKLEMSNCLSESRTYSSMQFFAKAKETDDWGCYLKEGKTSNNGI
jgi:hypothetical protein